MSRTATKAKPAAPTLFAEKDAPPVTQVAEKPKATAKPPKAQQAVATVTPLRKANPGNTLAVIADALKDPNFKPENMRLVLDMHQQMVAEQARLDFIAALHAMKRELPIINKDGKIVIVAKDASGKRPETGGRVQQSTPYATFENIMEKIEPILDRNGFVLTYSTEPSPDGAKLLVKGLLEHIGGHHRTTVFPLPAEVSGSKNNVQGWGSTLSYGKRYCTIAILAIRTRAPEDRDTDGTPPKMTKGGRPQIIDGDVVVEDGRATEEPEPIVTQNQLDEIRRAIERCGVEPATFCKKFDIASVSALPASRYADAIESCKNYRKKG